MDAIVACPIVNVLGKPDVIGISLAIAVFITGVFFSMRLQYIHGFQRMHNQACTHYREGQPAIILVKLNLERAMDYRKQAAFLGRRFIEMVVSIFFILIAMLISVCPNASDCAQITACVFISLGVIVTIFSSISVFLRFATDCQCNEFLFRQGLVDCLEKLTCERGIEPSPLAATIIPEGMLRRLENEIKEELNQHPERDT